MNIVFLTGNIGKIESQYTPKGDYVCKFSLAVNIGYGEKKTTEWYNCTAWAKLGEIINGMCQKGTTVVVLGQLVHRPWQTKDGENKISQDVTVSQFEIVKGGKPKEEAGSDPEPEAEEFA